MIVELHHDSGSLKLDLHLWELIQMATDNGHLPPSLCRDMRAFVDGEEVERPSLEFAIHGPLDSIATYVLEKMNIKRLELLQSQVHWAIKNKAVESLDNDHKKEG